MDILKQKLLSKQLISSNKNAINELHELYSKRLYNFVFSYLKTEEDTLDVVQNVFISIWEKRKKIKPDANLEAYLFSIAKNSIISHFRKKITEKNYLEHLKNTVIISYNNTEDQYDYDLLYNKIQELVELLPEQRKRIFKMSKDEGLTNKDIAKQLDISVKTVEDHKSKAKLFIKNKLKESGFLALLFWELFM